MRALVTGGGGFLGQVIVEKLLNRGNFVRVLGRGVYPELKKRGVETYQADVRDFEKVSLACKDIDTVFHVASKVSIWGKWKDFFETNVVGTKNVISACKKNGVEKLVYTSSPSVVSQEDDLKNVDEKIPYPKKFNCHYAASKAMAEKLVLAENGDLLTVSLRPHLIWGPRDTNIIPRLIKKAKHGKLVKIGDGKNIVDMVYVNNAADAHILAAVHLAKGSAVCGAYFITQGEPLSLWPFIDRLLEGFGIEPIKKSISYTTAYRLGIIFESIYTILGITSEPPMTRFIASQMAKSHFFNIEKAKNELHYTPAITTEEGLKRLFEYYREHPID